MQAAGNGDIRYRSSSESGGTLTVRLDARTHLLALTATGADLWPFADITRVSIAVSGGVEATCDYGLHLAANRSGMIYKY